MIHTQDELTARRVILLRDVSKNVLPLSVATIRQRMKEAGIPELKLGPRRLAMYFADLDALLARSTRPVD